MFVRGVVSMLLVLVLAACAERPADNPLAPVKVAPGLFLRLPLPDELGRTVEASQMLTARFGDRSFVFEGHFRATAESFLMLGLDPMGREMLRITWTRAGLDYRVAPWMPSAVRPENMVADIVFLYWPEDVVHRMLDQAGGELVSGPHSRLILFGGKAVLRADYESVQENNPWTGRLHFSDLAAGYSLDIQSVETQP